MESLVGFFREEATLWLPRVVGAAVTVVLFFILAKVARGAITRAAERLQLDGSLTSLLARTSSIALMLFGFVTALGTLGINVSALVAGLGLTGFALGFALKDTISNLLSGVLLLLYQPFKVGNRIKILGYEGVVVSIDLRYTRLDCEGNTVLVPNAKLFSDPITVLS